MNPSVSEVYQRFVWNEELSELASKLYDTPALTMGAVFDETPPLLERYAKTQWHSGEKKTHVVEALISANRRLGVLTPKVKANISKLYNGVVEAGHQTIVLGGPCYILNKAATIARIAALGHDKDLQFAPLFFLADYDTVQSELTNVRTPNVGQEGNLVGFPVEEGFEHSPVSAIPLPKSEWYTRVEESIRNSYRPLTRSLDSRVRVLHEERLEHAMALTRWAYDNSKTLGEWGAKIMGRLFNIEGNLGIPLLPASDDSFRSVLVEGLELLLARRNRERFLAAHDAATFLIEENGFRAHIGARTDSYVPFFYECSGKDCHRARIQLAYQESGKTAVLSGKCPNCGDVVSIETNTDTPDLSDVSNSLSPRVDSRQMAMDTLLPVVVHVGGTGETAYYAQVIPVAKELGLPFPEVLKYPRVYFNTPWNEELAGTLSQKGLPTLHSPEMFKTIGRIARFRKKKAYEEMNSALAQFDNQLQNSHMKLNHLLADLESRRREEESRTSDDNLKTRLELEKYLSWVYGQFTEGKIGQEATWSWMEWAVNSGFPDLFGPYWRAYVAEMKNGATHFVNFTL
ncbi:MAG: bacillithiol biosynthesis BshC [Candidatus Thorarchaeota archaeon]